METISANIIGYIDKSNKAIIQPMTEQIAKECEAKGFTLIYAKHQVKERLTGYWTTVPPATPNKQFRQIYPKREVVHHKQCSKYLPEDYIGCNCGAE